MFPCSGCGLCCQNISSIQELKEFDLGNGVCKYFDYQSSTCTIYDTRPDICRIEKMFVKKYHKYFSKKEFYILNATACNELQERFNMDNKFKVIIGD